MISFRAAGLAAVAVLLPSGASAEDHGQRSYPHGPVLLSFDGGEALAVAVYRQRMLTAVINYTLTVDTEGRAVDCEIVPRFRRRAPEIAICRPLMKYMVFEPARDEAGRAITGTYSDAIDMRTGIKPEL